MDNSHRQLNENIKIYFHFELRKNIVFCIKHKFFENLGNKPFLYRTIITGDTQDSIIHLAYFKMGYIIKACPYCLI